MIEREKYREQERERENRLEPGWTLMYCQADIVNALVPGICRARSCMSLPPVRFRYRRYLPIRRPSVRLCVHRNTRAGSWEPRRETERQTCCVCMCFDSAQQDLGTYCARDRRNTERGRSRTREVIDVRL